MKDQEIRFLIQSKVQKLVLLLIRDFNLSILDAFTTVYNSDVYKLLTDVETGLYFESAIHVYAYLKKEYKKGSFLINY